MGILSNDQLQKLQKYLSTFQHEESRPEPPVEKLTSTEPIVGYRIWSTMKQGGQLYLSSVAYPTQWPYRRALERDAIKDKGIHALKSGPGLSALWSSYYEAAVAGEVYLWGRVTECELGYLAQFAYPKRLFVPDSTDPTVVMGLEDGYGVPCEMRPEFVKQPYNPVEDPAGVGIGQLLQPMQQLYPQSRAQQQQGWQQAQQIMQHYQQANALAQSNAAMMQNAMMQNAMLCGAGIVQMGKTHPGQIVEVDLDTYGPFLGLPGK